MSESKNKKNLSRREFIGGAVVGAAALAGFTGCNAFPTIVPRHVLGGPHFVPPSEMVRIAKVGCSNMGQQDLDGIKAAGENQIVALCDVDWDKAAPAFKEYPKAKQFKDFRVMLDEMGDSIDAVMVSTPDHNHAVISMAAIKQGKHVFCQKPLTHNIYEARMLTEAAKKYGVATLMGIQGHSFEGIRLMDEWINHYKVIGKVSEVHIWTDRLGWNHQWHGNLPTDLPPVPKNMDWDTWIGPGHAAPLQPLVSPQRLARLLELRLRRDRRYGLPFDGCVLSCAETRLPDARLGPGLRPERPRDAGLVDHHLRIPGARRDAARQTGLV